ncbi:MAG: heme-dependent oxidative N-demethylase subunit alpha family protein [Rhizobacter sp.]
MAFDFNGISAPFRMQPGLRRLAAGCQQLTPTRPGDRVLTEKLAVLDKHPTQALLVRSGFDARPALKALFDQAAAEHPDAWHRERGGRACALRLGWSVHNDRVARIGPEASASVGRCLEALPGNWRAAALFCLAFAEDFAVIEGDSACIPWLAVCLPSHWAPENKIGRHFAEVHAPVADNQLLIAASEHLARLVTGDDRWQRQVWTITRHPHLQAHPARVDPADWPPDADADQLAEIACFRTEQQTFIPLAGHRQAIFTIRVELQPLTLAIADPTHAQRLHDALQSMSDAVLAYRSLSTARDRLLDWLHRRSTGRIA